MSSWIKSKLLNFLATKETELSRQIDYAQSVLDSSSCPEDVKTAVADILVSRKASLKRTVSLKNFCH